ncbi:MAG: hypothetical protein CML29_11280 [Rhizobiales bacterium]|nr:hypothetical protein [Hyphomicrobiales bacterium]MBA67797.1 hypothetical protein [Hyphomicrobiales bacterium]
MEWNVKAAGRAQALRDGIVAILAAVLLLSLSDAIVKLSGSRFSLAQLVLLRSVVAAAIIAAATVALGARPFSLVSVSRWVWLRSLCLAAMLLCYYAALPLMSFALAAACYYTAPVWIALLARATGGEGIGILRWTGIAIALAGVLTALDLGAADFGPAVLLPLTAGLFYALAAVVTARKCAHTNAFAMAFNLNLVLVAASGLGLGGLALSGFHVPGDFVTGLWPGLAMTDWLLALLLGVFLAIITALVAHAYSTAPATVVGVFDNGYLVFAAIWSLTLFGTAPGATELLGLSMITVGAVLATPRR